MELEGCLRKRDAKCVCIGKVCDEDVCMVSVDMQKDDEKESSGALGGRAGGSRPGKWYWRRKASTHRYPLRQALSTSVGKPA